LDVVDETMFRYNDGQYVVAYDLPDDATLRVMMIARVSG